MKKYIQPTFRDGQATFRGVVTIPAPSDPQYQAGYLAGQNNRQLNGNPTDPRWQFRPRSASDQWSAGCLDGNRGIKRKERQHPMNPKFGKFVPPPLPVD